MSGWTPGPWAADEYGLMVHAEDGAMRVCDIRGWGRLTGKGSGARGLSEQEAIAVQFANANLIAAAPALYQELEDALTLAESAMRLANRDGAEFDVDDCLAAGRAALARARTGS